jgi:catechol 2,3-dioxygenase-like lactoylglutathione lyase family enzyme
MNETTSRQSTNPDIGATHIALPVTDVEGSIAFYAQYAGMQVVHRRADPTTGQTVVWMRDLTRPFVVVLIQAPAVDGGMLGFFAHLGVGVASREVVAGRIAQAQAAGLRTLGPIDSGYPVGYWGYIVHPDGHNLELSYGQEVGLTVAQNTEAGT